MRSSQRIDGCQCLTSVSHQQHLWDRFQYLTSGISGTDFNIAPTSFVGQISVPHQQQLWDRLQYHTTVLGERFLYHTSNVLKRAGVLSFELLVESGF